MYLWVPTYILVFAGLLVDLKHSVAVNSAVEETATHESIRVKGWRTGELGSTMHRA